MVNTLKPEQSLNLFYNLLIIAGIWCKLNFF